jgi:hypothetical protein
MSFGTKAAGSVLCLAVVVAGGSATTDAQKGAETFTATATVKTAGGATTSAPVTIVIDRTMPQGEADRLVAAFRTGGEAALRKALVGVPPTGSIRLGEGMPTPTRLTVERLTDKGRLLTIVADQPIVFLGSGRPGVSTTKGYDFAVADIEVDRTGNGAGTLSPAAKVALKDGAFVVEDYGAELVRLSGINRVR